MLSVLTPCGLNLQLVLLKDPLRFFAGYSSYGLSSKTNTFKFQFHLSGETTGHRFICLIKCQFFLNMLDIHYFTSAIKNMIITEYYSI